MRRRSHSRYRSSNVSMNIGHRESAIASAPLPYAAHFRTSADGRGLRPLTDKFVDDACVCAFIVTA
jgi:hypothetical protein